MAKLCQMADSGGFARQMTECYPIGQRRYFGDPQLIIIAIGPGTRHK
jgi:hypothetical protein